MRICQIIACMFIAIASVHPAKASLVVNGSFEQASPGYAQPGRNWTNLNSSGAIFGWQITGSNDVAWMTNNNSYGLATPYGTYFLDLTGAYDRSAAGRIEQTITTTPGESYILSFSVGVDNSLAANKGPVSISAFAGSASEDFVNVDATGSGNVWTTETMTFTAESTSTLIALQGSNAIRYLALDNVSVDLANPPAVPEPRAAFLLAAGMLGLFLMRRGKPAI